MTAAAAIALSDDGYTMVSCTDTGWLQLWSRGGDNTGWAICQRERACKSEVNALALRGGLLLTAAADGRLRAWRLDGGGKKAAPFLFNLRTLQEPPRGAPGVAEGEHGLMCVAMPPRAPAAATPAG